METREAVFGAVTRCDAIGVCVSFHGIETEVGWSPAYRSSEDLIYSPIAWDRGFVEIYGRGSPAVVLRWCYVYLRVE